MKMGRTPDEAHMMVYIVCTQTSRRRCGVHEKERERERKE